MTERDERGAYAEVLDGLGRMLVEGTSLRDTLDQLLEVSSLAVPAVSAFTITAVAEDGSFSAAAWSDDRARAIDELEYAIEEGPCIEALRTGQEQLVQNTATDDRWPTFAARARQEGFGTVAGLPLTAPNGVTIGALNTFVEAADGLDDDALEVLRRVCGPATVVLANARTYRRAADLGDQLTRVLDERAVTHRAVGMLLANTDDTPEKAFGRLRAVAAREGTDVRDVAQRIVTGGGLDSCDA